MKTAVVALVWLGIVLGVSFLATPMKFQAPSLDLPTALEVGRVTFDLLARVEWLLAFVLVGVATLCKERLPWSAFVVFAIVVLQATWLSPSLGARTDAISAGSPLMPSRLHDVFVALEIIKCGALGHIGWRMSKERRTRGGRPEALPRELHANLASSPSR